MSMTKNSAAFQRWMDDRMAEQEHSYTLYLEEQYLSMERQARKGHTDDPQAEYNTRPTMKLYKVDFDPMYPVGCCLVLLAENEEKAWTMARETVTHTKVKAVQEVPTDKAIVVEYMSGDY